MTDTAVTPAVPARRRVSVAARLLSAVVAVVFAPLGVAVLASAGDGMLRAVERAGSGIALDQFAWGVLGIVLLLFVVQTGHSSTLGLWIAGIGFTLLGLLPFAAPVAAIQLTQLVRGVSDRLVEGLQYWAFGGFLEVLGVLFIATAVVVGHAGRARRGARGRLVGRILSIVVALLVASAAGALLSAGSAGSIRATLQFARPLDVAAAMLVVFAAILYGGALLTGLGSTLGLFVVGALTFAGGIVGFLEPHLVLANGAASGSSTDAAFLATFGVVALIGAVFMATAVVVRGNRRRVARLPREDSAAPSV